MATQHEGQKPKWEGASGSKRAASEAFPPSAPPAPKEKLGGGQAAAPASVSRGASGGAGGPPEAPEGCQKGKGAARRSFRSCREGAVASCGGCEVSGPPPAATKDKCCWD
jgi:hypothetical protein